MDFRNYDPAKRRYSSIGYPLPLKEIVTNVLRIHVFAGDLNQKLVLNVAMTLVFVMNHQDR
jgi:hypothetical protein